MPPEADKSPSLDDLARAILKSETLKVGPGLADVQMGWARQKALRLRTQQTEQAALRELEALRRSSTLQLQQEAHAAIYGKNATDSAPAPQAPHAPTDEEGTADSSQPLPKTRRVHKLSRHFRGPLAPLIQQAVEVSNDPFDHRAVWELMRQKIEANPSRRFELVGNEIKYQDDDGHNKTFTLRYLQKRLQNLQATQNKPDS